VTSGEESSIARVVQGSCALPGVAAFGEGFGEAANRPDGHHVMAFAVALDFDGLPTSRHSAG
jgi:hypothetical protein